MKQKKYKIKNSTYTPKEWGQIRPTGWICPLCGRALSPWTSCCPCFPGRINIYQPPLNPITNPPAVWDTSTTGRPQSKTTTAWITTYPPTEGQPIKMEYPDTEDTFIGNIEFDSFINGSDAYD